MAFVRGLMGPYMRPIPTGASAAMLFSLAVAFIVTPWAALPDLPQHATPHGGARREARAAVVDAPLPPGHGRARRERRRCAGPSSARWSCVLFAAVAAGRRRPRQGEDAAVRQQERVPGDGRPPRGHAARGDARDRAADERSTSRAVPEVADVQLYAGNAAPFNFNGLVRHYFLRRSPQCADLQVNLAPKGERDAQSHDIAKRVRPALVEIAKRRGRARARSSRSRPGRRSWTRWWPRSTARREAVRRDVAKQGARPLRDDRRASWTCTTRWRRSATGCS